MSDREQAASLLQVARRDLRALTAMRDPEAFADEVFGFMAQQVAEKCLKAWLAALGEQYPFSHDLADLISRVEEAGQEVADLWPLVDLNPFAVEFRYGQFSLVGAATGQGRHRPAGELPLRPCLPHSGLTQSRPAA